MKRFIIVISVLILLALLAVAVFTLYRARLIKSIIPDIEEVNIENIVIENGIGQVHSVLTIENQDVLNYQILSINVLLFNGSTQIMQYKRDTAFTLLSGERQVIDLQFELDARQIMKRVRTLQDRDTTVLRVSGDIVFDLPFKPYTLSIDKSIKVKVPSAPDIQIREIEFLGVRSTDSIDFNLHISTKNNNPDIIGIHNAAYRFSIPGFIESNGELPDVDLDTALEVLSIVPVTFVSKRRMELLSTLILKSEPLDYELSIDGSLLLRSEKNSEIDIHIIKKDKLVYDKKKKKKSNVKITNTRKKKRQAEEAEE